MPVEADRRHPHIHQSWCEWSEEQTLHIILVYNNPFRWHIRRELFEQSLRHMRQQANVRVYPIELAFDQRPFEVTTSQDIQLRTDSVLWHKENLINIAVQRFPAGWRYGGYWDADFVMTRPDWALQTIHALQHHQFVQMFSSYADLSGGYEHPDRGHRPYRITSSFAWNYLHQNTFRETWKERLKARSASAKAPSGDNSSYGIRYQELVGDRFPYGMPPGATGGGWAWRRQAFTTVGGLLDTCILGSADWHMAFGLAELTNVAAEMKRCTKPYMQRVLHWQSLAASLKGHPGKSAIGCIDHHVIHHFHGSKTRRAYGDRWHILRKHAFDPGADLRRDWQGVYQLTGNKPEMRDDIVRYFIERKEDSYELAGSEKELV